MTTKPLMNTISVFTAKPAGRFFYHKVPAKFIVAENTEQGSALEFVTTTARSRKGAVHLLICRWIWITDEAKPAFFYHYPQFLNWELRRPTSRPQFKPDEMPLPNYIQYARTGFSGALQGAESSPIHIESVSA